MTLLVVSFDWNDKGSDRLKGAYYYYKKYYQDGHRDWFSLGGVVVKDGSGSGTSVRENE